MSNEGASEQKANSTNPEPPKLYPSHLETIKRRCPFCGHMKAYRAAEIEAPSRAFWRCENCKRRI